MPVKQSGAKQGRVRKQPVNSPSPKQMALAIEAAATKGKFGQLIPWGDPVRARRCLCG